MRPSALGAEAEKYLCRLLENGSQGGSYARADPGAAAHNGRGGHDGDPRQDVRSPAAPLAQGPHGADLRLKPADPEASGSDDTPARPLGRMIVEAKFTTGRINEPHISPSTHTSGAYRL